MGIIPKIEIHLGIFSRNNSIVAEIFKKFSNNLSIVTIKYSQTISWMRKIYILKISTIIDQLIVKCSYQFLIKIIIMNHKKTIIYLIMITILLKIFKIFPRFMLINLAKF